MSEEYVLNPHVRFDRYANGYFAYDSRLAGAPLVEIPIQQITAAEFQVLDLLKTRVILRKPRTAEALQDYATDKGFDPGMLATFIQRRFLAPHRDPKEEFERNTFEYFKKRHLGSTSEGGDEGGEVFDLGFDQSHFCFTRNTFFNLPDAVAPDYCHVGILGFPHASLNLSLGTTIGPDQLRLMSRSLSWLDIQKQGVYSEVTLDQGAPDVICQAVVIRDCGDLQCADVAIPEIPGHVEERLTTEFFGPGVYPLIIGGDHAITYPLVRAHLAKTPNLGLLHLDAHNDLFYTPNVVYSHAAPVSNLVRGTGIERVVSFGLRTFTDTQMAGLRSIYEDPDATSRIRLRSLATTKRLIMDPRRLEEELRALADRPYYISLDLDVLSASATGRQVSTPFGVGLEWYELFLFLVTAFRCLDVVGFDIVEYNPLNGDGGAQYRYFLNSLLLIVIDGLAKGNPRFQAGSPPAPSRQARADR